MEDLGFETYDDRDPIEVRGWVQSIQERGNTKYNRNAVYTVLLGSTRTTITIESPYFSPLEEDDHIALVGVAMDATKTRILAKNLPLVEIGCETTTIGNCFRQALSKKLGRQVFRVIDQLLTHLKRVVGSECLVDPIGVLIDRFLVDKCEDYLMTNDQEHLRCFDGILNADQCEVLFKYWFKRRVLRRLYLFGLNMGDIQETELRPSTLYQIITRDNPYIVASLNMERCAHILSAQGLTPNRDQLEYGPILRHIYKECKQGNHSRLPIDSLDLDLDPETIQSLLEYGVETDGEWIWLSFVRSHEDAISRAYRDAQGHGKYGITDQDILDLDGISLSVDQRIVIAGILNNGWTVMTGPAGSGKTTILKTCLELLLSRSKNVLIVSFTGKAVSRVKQVIGKLIDNTDITVQTMHRFMAVAKPNVRYDHIFVDEASMVSVPLFGKFISKFAYPVCVTLIGDPYQLPPIGWASMLDCAVVGKSIPKYNLTQVHRCSNDDYLYINTMAIRNWKPEQPLSIKESKRFLLRQGGIAEIRAFCDRFLKLPNVDIKDVVILSPYNKQLAELNDIVRSHLPPGPSARDNIPGISRDWKLHERVMVIKNNYDLGIMNGEDGIITEVRSTSIFVTFPQREPIEFSLTDTSQDNVTFFDDDSFQGVPNVRFLIPSFAITVHKSQGSEYKYVIGYLPRESKIGFINRKIMYTLMTRARTSFILFGNLDVFNKSLVHPDPVTYQGLSERL